MQAYICRQDLTTPNNIGLKKLKMPQASLSVTPYSSAATINPLTPTTPGSSTSPLKPGSMPSITRETLALRLRQNWLAKHPIDPPLPTSTSSMDDSLTSLNWLQNLNIMKMATNPTPPASPQPADTSTTPQYTPSMQVNPNAILNMGCSSNSVHVKQEPGLVQPPRVNPYMDMVSPSSSPGLDKVDYKTNPCVKPPFSYATLICMAMKETKKNKITLAGIYNWITENFMYYKVAEPSWQNSIRHNLSLNKCFQKVARRKDEPGKGGFWRINPEYEDNFINGIFKKRRGSTSIPIPIQSTGVKRRREMVEPDSDSGDSNSYNGTYSYRPSKMAHVDIKKEPVEAIDTFEDGMEFNWSSILGQDIEVGGVKVKTEDIIDGDVASPITAMSPPPSEGSTSNQDDIVLDDFFNTELGDALASDEPLDFTTGGPLDLSISGMSLKAPQWWDEGLVGGSNENDDGLHTPVAQSPAYTHPWAEDKQELDNAIACFDTDFANLIDIENMPSPQLANLHADS